MSGNVCPECGGWKSSEFELCFDCGADECPECGAPKLKEHDVCRLCDAEWQDEEPSPGGPGWVIGGVKCLVALSVGVFVLLLLGWLFGA